MNNSVSRNTTHNKPNQETIQCLSIVKWVNKSWYIHMTDYHTAKRMNDLQLLTTWMILANTILSERNQMQKSTDCEIPFTHIQNQKQNKFMVLEV